MAKGNKAHTTKPAETPVVTAPASKFSYSCPSCGNVAIKTSNKMIGVQVNCLSCGVEVRLEDESRYSELDGQSDHEAKLAPEGGDGQPPMGNDVTVQ